ncbi:MAG TPA: hypothetical protein PLZ93_02020 [Nocardioides sp.]|uniref:hypothetical protein n=1 Tax=uncultured Nocardioides sp. TaxID=198441 RepID=UPI000EBEAFDA|nr:hypothetical protein [uncultured Nocardioides sp.]HCB03028.1 hypothetical protein [Nocardioides sp.]HRD59414.1 hypothetical protein [Nocardioides sp.]HRI94372.1 hypothetical protein [Nocardioides sp.]HRK44264.1 hypothetical protein [Nocardioides sp.]
MHQFERFWRRGAAAVVAVGVAVVTFVGSPSSSQAAPGDNTINLEIEPTVPAERQAFQVRASGIATASQSANIFLAITMAPADVACYSTSDLEQARAESGTYAYDPRWEFWGAAFVAGNGPDHEAYLVSKVTSNRPTGRYRLCGYLRGQGEGPDPYVATRLDFTVGGTCADATSTFAAAQAAQASAAANVQRADHTMTRAKKVLKKAKRAVKRAKKNVAAATRAYHDSATQTHAAGLVKATKALHRAKKKAAASKRKAGRAKVALTTARSEEAEATRQLKVAQTHSALLCP